MAPEQLVELESLEDEATFSTYTEYDGFLDTDRHLSFASIKDAAKTASHLTPEQRCPRGHGPLQLWNGALRCWECGYPEK